MSNSQHTISEMKQGESKWISNNTGEYILTRVPMDDKHTLYKYPDSDIVIESVNNILTDKFEEILNVETDKIRDQKQDNMINNKEET
tara:strand:+ start:1352 stop:1612 length:261 start_codon:yes stop_codon:yes gene_type:complete